MSARTLDWTGSSGMFYRYWILGMDANLNAEPGNYIIAREGAADWYDAIYVGHTDDLSKLMQDHPQMECISDRNPTHLFVHASSPSEQTRQAEADDITRLQEPFCNG